MLFRRALRIRRLICLANHIVKVPVDFLQLAQIKCTIICFASLKRLEVFEMFAYRELVEVNE